jgi:hypothetical protein
VVQKIQKFQIRKRVQKRPTNQALLSGKGFYKLGGLLFGLAFAATAGFIIYQSFASNTVQTGRTGRPWHFFVAPMTLNGGCGSIRSNSASTSGNDSQWAYVNQNADVFQSYECYLNMVDANTLAAQAGMIKRTGLKTSVEVGGLRPYMGCQAGSGQRYAQQITLHIINNYVANGGSVDYLMIDSPAYSMMPPTTQGGCGYDINTLANELASYVATVRASYPNVIFGWNEPVPYYSVGTYPAQNSIGLPNLPTLIQAVNNQLQSQGLSIDIFRADSPFEYSENTTTGGWQKLAALESNVRQQGMRFAMIFNSERGGNTSDQLFYQDTLTGWNHFVSAAGVPDEIFVQSWYIYPSSILPETQAYSFMYTAKALLEAALMNNATPVGSMDLVDSAGNAWVGPAIPTTLALLCRCISTSMVRPELLELLPSLA